MHIALAAPLKDRSPHAPYFDIDTDEGGGGFIGWPGVFRVSIEGADSPNGQDKRGPFDFDWWHWGFSLWTPLFVLQLGFGRDPWSQQSPE